MGIPWDPWDPREFPTLTHLYPRHLSWIKGALIPGKRGRREGGEGREAPNIFVK